MINNLKMDNNKILNDDGCKNEPTLGEGLAECELEKCGKRGLKSSFYGTKRFCSSSCAHAYSGSRPKKKAEKKEVRPKKKAIRKRKTTTTISSNSQRPPIRMTLSLVAGRIVSHLHPSEQNNEPKKARTSADTQAATRKSTDDSHPLLKSVKQEVPESTEPRKASTRKASDNDKISSKHIKQEVAETVIPKKQENVYATCEWHKCGVKKLRKDFIGKKRFCSTQCAHAFSGSRGGRAGKDKNKIKQEIKIVKKSEPRARVRRQQINRRTVVDPQETADDIESLADSENDHYQRQYPDIPRKTNFWHEVFHNGFHGGDYYNDYLDGHSHEILDRIYMILTQKYYKNAFKSVFEPLLKNMKTHEPELNKKELIARKYEVFDEIVEAMVGAYNKYGVECYNLFSNNGTHQPNPDFDENKKDDLEDRLYSHLRDELIDLLENQPSGNKLNTDELDRCLQGFTDIVDSDAIYQTSIIMNIIKGYQIPADPVRHLKRAVAGILMEIFKKQRFFAKRLKPVTTTVSKKDRKSGYMSDFSDGDY